MIAVLVALLLAATAFTTPLSLNPVSNNNAATLHTRQDFPNSGPDSGITISFYTQADCKGGGLDEGTLIYNIEYARQIRSYKLGSDLGPDDVLNIWNDVDWKATGRNPVDPSIDGNLEACAQFAYSMEGDATKKGCFTLPNVVDSMIMTYNQS